MCGLMSRALESQDSHNEYKQTINHEAKTYTIQKTRQYQSSQQFNDHQIRQEAPI
jgi:hypothetical protein